MRTTTFIIVIMLGFSPAAVVAQKIPAPIDDAALAKAMAEAKERSQRILGPGNAQLDEKSNGYAAPAAHFNVPISKDKAADPAAIANRYRETMLAKRGGTDDLLVFVSLSMPQATLKRLAEQANRAGAVLVLRGLKGGIGKGHYKETVTALKPLAETGATVQIDPEAFARYNVGAVPTFVLAARQEDCGGTKCAVGATAVTGDVSLEYALEHMVDRNDGFSKVAQARLRKMRGGR